MCKITYHGVQDLGVSNANSVGFAPLGIINGAVLVALLRPRNKDNAVTEEADLPRTTYYPEKGAASASSENDSWSIVCALLPLQEILDCVLLDASYSRPPLRLGYILGWVSEENGLPFVARLFLSGTQSQ